MTLKEFYKFICKEFNGGEPLEYKWTRKDGYWKMTKGFPSGPNKGVYVHILAEHILQERAMKKEQQKAKPSKKKKKPYIKYKGD
jgi:hypothetical protein